MKTVLRHALTALILAATPIVLAGCITDPVTGESRLGYPMSVQSEQAMGLQAVPSITQEFGGAYPDARVQRYLSDIVVGMADTSARPDLDWSFTLLNSSVPNAFALPGGNVFMTRGLIWRMDDEAEFAVVMGHEIGHVEHKHAAVGMGRDMLLGLGAALGAAALDNDMAAGLLSTGAGLVSLRYGRDQERESDIRGVEHSYAHGYDPREGADVFREFQRIKQEAGGGESAIDAWTSSHPLDSERIASILELSASKDRRLDGNREVPGLRRSTSAWESLIGRLRAEQAVYDRGDEAMKRASAALAEGRENGVRRAIPTVQSCASDLPGHAHFRDVLGRLYFALEDTSSAMTHFRAASRMNQGLVQPEYYLSVISLDQQRPREAVSYADRALQILPGHYALQYVRAEGLWQMGRKDEARAAFQSVVQQAPEQSEEYAGAAGRLGVGAKQSPQTQPEQPRSNRQKRNRARNR